VGGAYALGQIVNSSRSFGRQVTTFFSQFEAETLRKELVYRQIAWVNVLRTRLRDADSWEEREFFVTENERAALAEASTPVDRLLQIQNAALMKAREAGWLSDVNLLMFDNTFNALHDAQGGCERIKNTRFPDRVAYFGRVVAWGLAVFIPFVVLDLVEGVDIVDVTVVPLMMFAFVVTERIGAELRTPFSNHANDVPMKALCRTIEIHLRQQLGEREAPAPLEPENGVLM
jgi:putative membrane protein